MTSQVKSVRCVITKKVRAHCPRLREPVRTEGLMTWRRMALATRKAGLAVHCGTVAVERMWAILKSMLPPPVRCVSFRWFSVLAQFMHIRYNHSHFHPELPVFTDGDPLMAQRMSTLDLLVSESAQSDGPCGLDHFFPLFDPFEEV